MTVDRTTAGPGKSHSKENRSMSTAAMAATIVVCILFVRWSYQAGYGQGRNDGFHAGWRKRRS